MERIGMGMVGGSLGALAAAQDSKSPLAPLFQRGVTRTLSRSTLLPPFEKGGQGGFLAVAASNERFRLREDPRSCFPPLAKGGKGGFAVVVTPHVPKNHRAPHG
jgi:hypothetical protein